MTQVLEERVQQMIEEARADFPLPEPLPGQKLTLDHPDQVRPVCLFCLPACLPAPPIHPSIHRLGSLGGVPCHRPPRQSNQPLNHGQPTNEQVLVRLKVEYTGFFTLNNQRFGQRYDRSI